MNTDLNASAFPSPDDYRQDGTAVFGPRNLIGLTKREWFAGLALAGLMASDTRNTLSSEKAADYACQSADALIAQLNREETT